MRVCKLLNNEIPPCDGPAERLWIEPSTPLFLGNETWLKLVCERDDETGEYRRQFEIAGRSVGWPMRLPVRTVIDLTRAAGVRVVPLAIELTESCAARVFAEFQGTDIEKIKRAAVKMGAV